MRTIAYCTSSKYITRQKKDNVCYETVTLSVGWYVVNFVSLYQIFALYFLRTRTPSQINNILFLRFFIKIMTTCYETATLSVEWYIVNLLPLQQHLYYIFIYAYLNIYIFSLTECLLNSLLLLIVFRFQTVIILNGKNSN